MNHLYKILSLLPLFFSCTNTQEEIIPIPEEEQPSIGFAAKVQNSRAEADLTTVQENGFWVWGGYEEKPDVFGGTKVTFDDTSNEWGYVTNAEPTRYWVLNQEYTFFAVYPEVTENVSVTNGTYSLVVETPATADEDILTASAYNDTGVTNFSNVVSFNFNHLMTKVNLMVGKV